MLDNLIRMTMSVRLKQDQIGILIRLCYTPKVFSCLEEIKHNINHCLELAPSFPKMYNITMFRFNIAKLQS